MWRREGQPYNHTNLCLYLIFIVSCKFTPHFTPQNSLELQTLNSSIILFAGLLMLFANQLEGLFEGVVAVASMTGNVVANLRLIHLL